MLAKMLFASSLILYFHSFARDKWKVTSLEWKLYSENTLVEGAFIDLNNLNYF